MSSKKELRAGAQKCRTKITDTQKRRLRVAKATILALLIGIALLALWQCTEGIRLQFEMMSTIEKQTEEGGMESGNTQSLEVLKLLEQSDGNAWTYEEGQDVDTLEDPLGIEQEGLTLVQANETADILWYESSWNISQSRALVERALVLQGWQATHEEADQIMSFTFSSSAIASGGNLFAMFYETEQGCSLLVETI